MLGRQINKRSEPASALILGHTHTHIQIRCFVLVKTLLFVMLFASSAIVWPVGG